MFALGQLYVLMSRVTDPNLFHGVGLPPADLLDDVARAWAAIGLDVNACFTAAAKVTGEWAYTAPPAGTDPCLNVRSRLKPIHQEERSVKLKLFSLCEILNPQPRAANVVHALLSWIDSADLASQANKEKPPFTRDDGSDIFPEGEEWWLTEIEKRKTPETQLDLASDNIAEDDLTINPSEAGSDTEESDTDGSASMSTDGGLPLIPRGRTRVNRLVAPMPGTMHHTVAAGPAATIHGSAFAATRRRLTKKTHMPAPQSTVTAKPDELDVLLAGAPGGKLVVSRDSYHSLPPSVQGAFKRGDARIVVAEDEGSHSSASQVADSLFALPRTRTPSRGAASASTP